TQVTVASAHRCARIYHCAFHASCRNKFFFISRFPFCLHFVSREMLHQTVLLSGWHIGPAHAFVYSRFNCQKIPKPYRQAVGIFAHYLLSAKAITQLLYFRTQCFFIKVWQPVNLNGKMPVCSFEYTCTPCAQTQYSRAAQPPMGNQYRSLLPKL